VKIGPAGQPAGPFHAGRLALSAGREQLTKVFASFFKKKDFFLFFFEKKNQKTFVNLAGRDVTIP
jgi:hypothetical protein